MSAACLMLLVLSACDAENSPTPSPRIERHVASTSDPSAARNTSRDIEACFDRPDEGNVVRTRGNFLQHQWTLQVFESRGVTCSNSSFAEFGSIDVVRVKKGSPELGPYMLASTSSPQLPIGVNVMAGYVARDARELRLEFDSGTFQAIRIIEGPEWLDHDLFFHLVRDRNFERDQTATLVGRDGSGDLVAKFPLHYDDFFPEVEQL